MLQGKKPFSLYSRKRKKGKPVYYVRFRLPDGMWSSGKNTGHTSKGAAEAWAFNYLQTGQVVFKENIILAEFAENFFSFEGDWATDKKVIGKNVSQRQCLEKTAILNNRILPIFGKLKLTEIDKVVIKEFRNNLYKQGLSGSSINKALSCLKVILESAEEKSLIQYVPKIERASDRPKEERGILTVDEVKQVLSVEWFDFRAYVMNLTAACTGLRRGELLALKLNDIHDDYIEILRSWDEKMGQMNQTTKTGRSRIVIIPEKVRAEIKRLIDINPWGKPESFLFFSSIERKPMEGKLATDSLYKAINNIGITVEERKQRNITFHSWRHWFNSLLINAKVPIHKIQSITGHLTEKMTQHYYHVNAGEMDDIKSVQESIFY